MVEPMRCAARDPNRWVSVASNKALQLKKGCTTNSRNRLFMANKVGNTLQLQSLSNRQWVIQRSTTCCRPMHPPLEAM